MNKEMIESENFVTVCTDKGLEKRERTNNIMEILKTENNIEEIETKKEWEKCCNYKEIREIISTRYLKKSMSYSLPISIIITIILVLCNVISFSFVGVLGLPLLTSLATLFVSENLTIDQTEKICNNIKIKQEEILYRELIDEKEKLKELNKSAIVDKSYDIGKIGKIQKIERTKLIDDLKIKLELIGDYQLMKKELIEYSKDHFTSPKLRDMGYSESDVEFIQMLIEQDIKEEEKQKTLNLKKNKR